MRIEITCPHQITCHSIEANCHDTGLGACWSVGSVVRYLAAGARCYEMCPAPEPGSYCWLHSAGLGSAAAGGGWDGCRHNLSPQMPGPHWTPRPVTARHRLLQLWHRYYKHNMPTSTFLFLNINVHWTDLLLPGLQETSSHLLTKKPVSLIIVPELGADHLLYILNYFRGHKSI